MKMYIFYKSLALAALFFLGSHVLTGQEKLSKKVEETFSMNHGGKLHLDNKYGDITITGWEKNSLEVTIEISVTHRKKENAQKLLERIQADIKTAGDFVSITSEISDGSKSGFSRYFNKANPFSFDKSNVRIDYTVYMPAKAELELTNKFGDVIIEDWVGKLSGDFQHGDVWINEDLNNADIDLKFGKLKAQSINYANLRLKNGGVSMDDAKDLRLNTSGSTVKLNKADLLQLYSSKDDITIETLGSISGDIRFATLHLNSVAESISLTLKVTDLMVYKMNKPNVRVDLKQESSDINIGISGLAFKFDATLEQGLLRIPKSFKNVDSKVLDKGRRIREISATYGENPEGKISIRGKKGIIQLKEL